MSEHTYESQNDQRLDELHTKVRTLRNVTIDINSDVERQNLTLDETGNTFSSFGSTLAQTSRKAARAFGLGGQGVKTWRTIGYVVGGLVGLWIGWKIISWWIE